MGPLSQTDEARAFLMRTTVMNNSNRANVPNQRGVDVEALSLLIEKYKDSRWITSDHGTTMRRPNPRKMNDNTSRLNHVFQMTTVVFAEDSATGGGSGACTLRSATP